MVKLDADSLRVEQPCASSFCTRICVPPGHLTRHLSPCALTQATLVFAATPMRLCVPYAAQSRHCKRGRAVRRRLLLSATRRLPCSMLLVVWLRWLAVERHGHARRRGPGRVSDFARPLTDWKSICTQWPAIWAPVTPGPPLPPDTARALMRA
jgi:hypothetical protein